MLISGDIMQQILKNTFAAAVFLYVFGGAVVLAQAAQVGTVTVNGAVPLACDIVVTAEAGASNIADISVGDTDRLIATVTESCNDPDGYTVSLVGTNSGDHTGLFVDSVSGDNHPFTVAYDGVPVPAGGLVTDSNAPQNNLSRDVRITYGAAPLLTPTVGFTYAETLTFTIAAK